MRTWHHHSSGYLFSQLLILYIYLYIHRSVFRSAQLRHLNSKDHNQVASLLFYLHQQTATQLLSTRTHGGGADNTLTDKPLHSGADPSNLSRSLFQTRNGHRCSNDFNIRLQFFVWYNTQIINAYEKIPNAQLSYVAWQLKAASNRCYRTRWTSWIYFLVPVPHPFNQCTSTWHKHRLYKPATD